MSDPKPALTSYHFKGKFKSGKPFALRIDAISAIAAITYIQAIYPHFDWVKLKKVSPKK